MCVLRINLGDMVDEAYGKSTYNYWRMNNNACAIILNGCTG
jgi:hypothetical protein